MSAVTAAGVFKYFGDFPALANISFEIPAGSCLALLGRNGAGKTTLLRILAGLSTPSQGRIELFGKPARDGDSRARIGLLGHGIGVYDELSAEENLQLFARMYRVASPDQAVSRWLERTYLDRVKDGLVREFSRGMRQRLAVARAFLHEPALLLLDEPFTSLDDRAIALLQTLMKEALARGATVIMSTHQIREAMEITSEVALLNRGKLAHHGPRPPEMLADPGWLYRNYAEGT